LIYSNPRNWEHPMFRQDPGFQSLPAAEQVELARQAEALGTEINASGEFVLGAALADPANTRTIRVRGGALVVTDGPYLEAKEYLAGTCVVECDSLERAAEIASRIPEARFAAVEIHPITDLTMSAESLGRS